MPVHPARGDIDHADRIDPRLRHQQAPGLLVPGQPDRQHAPISLESGDANRNVRFHRIIFCIDYRDCVVVGIGDENMVAGGKNSGGTASPVDIRAERQPRPHEALDLRCRWRRYVNHADRIRFANVRVAEPGNFDRAALGGPFNPVSGFRTRESKGREHQARAARLFGIGSGKHLIFEHPEVCDVELPSSGRPGHGKGKPSDFYGGDHLTRARVNGCDPEVGLVHHVEQAAFRVEREISGVTICIAILIQVDHATRPRSRRIRVPIEERYLAGVAFRDPRRMLVDQSDSHENAMPVVFGITAGFALGSSQQMTHVPVVRFISLQDRERVAPGASVCRDNGSPARAYR